MGLVYWVKTNLMAVRVGSRRAGAGAGDRDSGSGL